MTNKERLKEIVHLINSYIGARVDPETKDQEIEDMIAEFATLFHFTQKSPFELFTDSMLEARWEALLKGLSDPDWRLHTPEEDVPIIEAVHIALQEEMATRGLIEG